MIVNALILEITAPRLEAKKLRNLCYGTPFHVPPNVQLRVHGCYVCGMALRLRRGVCRKRRWQAMYGHRCNERGSCIAYLACVPRQNCRRRAASLGPVSASRGLGIATVSLSWVMGLGRVCWSSPQRSSVLSRSYPCAAR